VRRQFLRFYLGLVLVLSAAACAVLLLAEHEVRQAADRRLAQTLEVWMEGVQLRLQEAQSPEEQTALLARINEAAPFPVCLLPLAQAGLSAEEQEGLRAGGKVLLERGADHLMVAPFAADLVVVLGPVPPPMARPHRGGPPGARWPMPLITPDGELPPPGAGPPPWRGALPYLFFGALLAILVLVGLAIYLLLRPFERRIYALVAAARDFGAGRLDRRVEPGGGEAIAALADTFNDMAVRLEQTIGQQTELLRAVSHELRTPLARLFFMVDDAQAAATAPEKDQQLGRIETALQELNELVDELLAFVRLEGEACQPPNRELFAVAGVLAEVAQAAGELRRQVSLRTSAECPQVLAVPRLFRRALLNLVVNAVRYAQSQVELRCIRAGDQVEIWVDDDGPGIPAEFRPRLFEPFYRLDQSRSAASGGAGLGLAIVQRIMALHRGQAQVADSPLGGARFILSFPCA